MFSQLRPISERVTLHQWRTIHTLDGAFKSLDKDPQNLEEVINKTPFKGSITRLPKLYKGHRLGHNWSISWVVDHLKTHEYEDTKE